MNAVAQSLAYSAAPVIGMIAAGFTMVWWQPGRRVRSYIQHLAAGIVFGTVGVEVLPDVMHRQSPIAAASGFAVGVMAMLAIRVLSRRAAAVGSSSERIPWALVLAVVVDVFIDGILIGVGFAAGQRQGILLAVAITGCSVSLGLATAAALMRNGGSRFQAVALTSGVGLLPAVGAVVGTLLAGQLTGGWMETVLSFTCAALLYLVAEELLVEAHEDRQRNETSLETAVFFAGFLAVLIMDMEMGSF